MLPNYTHNGVAAGATDGVEVMAGRFWTWLRGLFGEGGSLEEYNVQELHSDAELDQALAQSAKQPVFIFKHSTVCPISAGAHRRVADYLEEAGDQAPPFYLVKVIEARPLSNAIAQRLDVRHQSPQLILVSDGEAVWHTSHGAINPEAIRGALEKSG